MKKTLSLFLAFIMMLSAVALLPFCGFTAVSKAISNKDAYDAIVKGLFNFDEYIDISEYALPAEIVDNTLVSNDYIDLINDIIYMNPLLYYVDFNMIHISYSSSSGTITGLAPEYFMTPDEVRKANAFIDNEVDKLFATVPPADGLSDFAKIIVVHDLVAANFEYDTGLTLRTLYDMLTYKKGVCQAYTLLYSYMLSRLGVNSAYSKSLPMVHAWNVVELDSDWYHVDCTWDDPENYHCIGRVGHSYMLKSDRQFINDYDASSHYGVTDDYECTNTAYDTYFWDDVIAPIIFTDEDTCWYISQKDGGALVKNVSGKDETVFTIDDFWFSYDSNGRKSNSYYTFCNSGLAYFDDCLYFNGAYTIWRYDIAAETVTEIYAVNDADGYINSLYVIDGVLYYHQSKSLTGSGTKHSLTIDYHPHTHNFGNWYVKKAPTVSSDGITERLCGGCGDTETKMIPRLSESNGYVYSVIAEPTYGIAGKAQWASREYGVFTTDIPALTFVLSDVLPDGCEIRRNVNGITYIYGISSETKVSSLSLPSVVSLLSSNGNALSSDAAVPNGTVLEAVVNGRLVDKAVIVILGDVVADGIVNEKDYQKAKEFVLAEAVPSDIQFYASDFDGNGIIDMDDYIGIRLYANK